MQVILAASMGVAKRLERRLLMNKRPSALANLV